jgi:hypothetical protein
VATDIGRAGQHLVDGVDAPASAVAGTDAGGIQMLGDRFDPHWSGGAIALPGQAEDQPYGLGLKGIDLQGLLDAVAALFTRDGAVADRRQRTVPKPLPGVFLHGPQGVLGIFLGLVFVEQRHDLADHVAHGVVAEFLGDRDQADAVLGKPAHVELELELVAEESAEAVHHDHVEHRRFRRGCVDHPLELRPPVVGSRRAGLDIVGHDLPAARGAVPLCLAALILDGEIAVGLPAS